MEIVPGVHTIDTLGMGRVCLAIGADRVEGVPPCKRIILLLVTLDPFFLANMQYIRGIVEETLVERGITRNGVEYQICPVPDFEELCRLLDATRRHLSTAVAEKIDGVYNVAGDVPTLEWDFSQWVSHVSPNEPTGRIPSHDEIYEAGLERLVNRFRVDARSVD